VGTMEPTESIGEESPRPTGDPGQQGLAAECPQAVGSRQGPGVE
jgi:hypothetical protein